jgi:hypothetical protein
MFSGVESKPMWRWVATTCGIVGFLAYGCLRRALTSRLPPSDPIAWSHYPVQLNSTNTNSLTFVFTCWGTRGDVQPCLVLAQELLQRGHKVRLLIGHEFESLAKKYQFTEEQIICYHNIVTMDEFGLTVKQKPLSAFYEFYKYTPEFFEHFYKHTEGADVIIGQCAPMLSQLTMMIAEKRKIPLFFTAHDPIVVPSPNALVFSKWGWSPHASSILHLTFVSLLFGWFSKAPLQKVAQDLQLEPLGVLNEAFPLKKVWNCPILLSFPKSVVPMRKMPAHFYQRGEPCW